ncbi:hypothetical protein WMY93_026908 [Mugilogobius chulae]|uniref:Ig-like domain-containing protein n=1 Tax=Mugilogobius chulae TaxID=88201 RepID=A0AAW0N5L2_9GOBI
MDAGITFGRAFVSCTLLLLALQVCYGAVTVKVTPTIEVLKGETAKLPCTHTASGSPIVEWFIDEQETRKRVAFPVGRSQILLPGHSGTSWSGRGTTELKVFFAPEKPELTKPSSQAIVVDQATSSEIGKCETRNGHPQPRIIWFKDDKPLPEVKDREQKTYMVPSLVKEASGLFTLHSKLYMTPTKADKDSSFYCMVEYKMPGGQVKQKESEKIKINLNYPSESATFRLLNTAAVKEGDTVNMKCETDGNPQPEFEFTKDGKALTGQAGMLILKSVKRTDAGEYHCTAIDFDNLDADLSGKISLSVAYIDPVSITPMEPQLVMLGDKVEWQCKTKGSDQHTVQWKKGSEVLSQGGTLSIEEVSYEKAGEYTCVGAVPSVPGLQSEASVNLTVKGKPMIETPAIGEVAKEGDMVTLKCASYGFPAPQFTWKPAGKESVTVDGNKVVSSVTLQATPDIMKSGVSCEVANEHGKDQKMVSVALKRADMQQGGSSSVVIAVVVCVLLLLLLVALIYFLNKKDKLPAARRTRRKATGDINNDIVVEMKTDKANEESGLLKKRPSTEQ